jgi:hypothetical protein
MINSIPPIIGIDISSGTNTQIMSKSKNLPVQESIVIRRGRIDVINLFEISEHELAIIEGGGSAGLFLNFSIFLLSIGLTGVTALSTATFKNSFIEIFFLIISIVGFLLGFFLLLLWWRHKESLKTIFTKIKNRMSSDDQNKII